VAETLRDRFDAPIRFWERFNEAGPSVLAAAVAYNIFFALVPAAVALVAGASTFGRSQDAIDRTTDALEQIAPTSVVSWITDVLAAASEDIDTSRLLVVILSVVVSLFLASRAVLTLQHVLARIEGMAEDRPWWKVRLIGMGLSAGIGIALVLTSVLLVAGELITEALGGLFESDLVVRIWEIANLPVGAVGVFLFLAAFYRWGPPRPLPGLWLAALTSTVGIVAASLGFRLYVRQAGELGTFAIIGAVAILLLWLFVISYVIMLTAALSAAVSRWWSQRRGTDGAPPPAGPLGDIGGAP